MRDGRLGKVRGVVTDNGCEFLDQKKPDRLFRAEIHYTHAYPSWEKGSVENCNSLLRFFFPKERTSPACPGRISNTRRTGKFRRKRRSANAVSEGRA